MRRSGGAFLFRPRHPARATGPPPVGSGERLSHRPWGPGLIALTRDRMIAHPRTADALAREAMRHAEAELARRAAAAYPSDFLWTCTLVTTGEPCATCAGTFHWANIGRLV